MSANGKTDELTPRQAAFLKAFIDPKSPTFGNALQSAKEAGYGPEYCKNITGQMPEWLSENIRDVKMIDKAERNLNNLLDSTNDKIQLDTYKFVLERLNKKKYAQRNEQTGANGGAILTKDVTELTDEELSDIIKD